MRRRVERRLGRRGGRSGLSEQCGESEISAMRVWTAASFERRTCHLEAKEVTEWVEGSSSARSSEISRRVSGEDGCAAVDCGGGTVAGGILFIYFFSFFLLL